MEERINDLRINDLGNKISKLEYSHIPELVSVFYEWSKNEGKPMYLNNSSDDEIEKKFHEYFKGFLTNNSYVGTKGGRRKSRKSKRTKKQRKSRKQRK